MHKMRRRSFALGLGATLLFAAPRDARAETIFGLSFAIVEGDDASRIVDDAWIQGQIDEANRLFGPLGTRFRAVREKPLAARHATLRTREDRDALTPLTELGMIDVFLVSELEDVDEPGRRRMGVCWTGKGGKRFIVVSRRARPLVLAHELGHFFGNRQHSDVVNNVMSYTHDGGEAFFDERQMATIKRFSERFLRSGRLFDVGPPRRTW